MSLENFSIPTLTLLGEGAFGKVYCARGPIRNREIALKVIAKEGADESADVKQDVKQEVQILTSLSDHANILQLHSYFADERSIYFVLELLPGGSLYDHEKPLSADMAARFILDICNGLSHCHRHNIIHRDLKSENLMLASDGRVKIIDFGLATFVGEHGNSTLLTICGSVLYQSPEMLKARYKGEKYGYSVDIWSMGVLLFELLAKDDLLPFGGSNQSDRQVWDSILNLDIQWPEEGVFSDCARDLISKLLVTDPSKRLPLEDITTHVFIQENLAN